MAALLGLVSVVAMTLWLGTWVLQIALWLAVLSARLSIVALVVVAGAIVLLADAGLRLGRRVRRLATG